MQLIQSWYGDSLPERNAACVEQVRASCMVAGLSHRLIQHPACADPCGESDLERVQLAAKTPDMIWADCDMEIDVPKLVSALTEKSRPYLSHDHGINLSLTCFFVNGCCDVFERLLQIKEEKGLPVFYGLIGKLVRYGNLTPENCYVIPQGIVNHHFFTLKGAA